MESAGLSLTVLGCDGSYPGTGGACSGYLIQCADTALWLDAGSGTMANLQQHIGLGDISAVVITHAHPDHWTDLEQLCVALKWGLRLKGPPVYAPEGLRKLMRTGSSSDAVDWNEITDDAEIVVRDLRLSFSRTDHPGPTFAVRVDGAGRSLGYSADSGPGWAMASLGAGLDLALCESTFLSDEEGSVQHLSARQAGATAAEAGAARLVLTHLAPRVDRDAARLEAEGTFGRLVDVASIGARYEV